MGRDSLPRGGGQEKPGERRALSSVDVVDFRSLDGPGSGANGTPNEGRPRSTRERAWPEKNFFRREVAEFRRVSFVGACLDYGARASFAPTRAWPSGAKARAFIDSSGTVGSRALPKIGGSAWELRLPQRCGGFRPGRVCEYGRQPDAGFCRRVRIGFRLRRRGSGGTWPGSRYATSLPAPSREHRR